MRFRAFSSNWGIAALVVWVLAVCLMSAMLLRTPALHATSGRFEAVERASEHPLEIEPSREIFSTVAESEYQEICGRMPPSQFASVTPPILTGSMVLHLLHLHGTHVPAGFDKPVELLDVLTNEDLAEKYLGGTFFCETRWGIRARLIRKVIDRNVESHRDQCLAMFAELGLPLSCSFEVHGRQHCIRDLLRDSVANFHLRQEDLEWTTLAYGRYLPPSRCWEDKFGVQYSFDDLTRALIARPLMGRPCGGSHVLEAATILLCAHMRCGLLSAEVERELRDYLDSARDRIVSGQLADGSFPAAWNAWSISGSAWSPEDTEESRVLAAGHLTEWFLALPKPMCVNRDVLVKAVSWLREHACGASSEAQTEGFCPYSHAFSVLRNNTVGK